MSYKKATFYFLFASLILIVFGQNFEWVPKKTFFPVRSNSEIQPHLLNTENIPSQKGFFSILFPNRAPAFAPQDNQNQMLEKTFNQVGNHFLGSSDFKGSEAGQTMESIQEKMQLNFSLNSSPQESLTSSVEFMANQNTAAFKIKQLSSETTCSYSVANQNFQLMLQKKKQDPTQYGLDFDPKNSSSQVKVQMSW